jgi:hypothetical protein
MGTGWNRGVIMNKEVRAMAENRYIFEGANSAMNAQISIPESQDVWYEFDTIPELPLDCFYAPTTPFTALPVDKDTEIKIMLRMGDEEETDSTQVIVFVRKREPDPRKLVHRVSATDKIVTIFVDESHQLESIVAPEQYSGTQVFWKTLHPEIACITPSGKLTGNSAGQTRAVVSIRNRCDTVSVNVVNVLVAEVRVTPGILELEVEEEYTLTATVLPENADFNEISWMGGNDSILIVDRNGKLTALREGSTWVVALNEFTGLSDTCLVTVTRTINTIDELPIGISIYPNPVREILYIKGFEPEMIAEVLSLTGRILYNSQNSEFKLGKLEPGFYLLRLRKGADTQLFRFLKE